MKSFGAKLKGLVSSGPSTVDLNFETARKEFTTLTETINKTYESLLKHDKNLQKTFIHPSSLNKNIQKYFPNTHPLANYTTEANKTIEASFNEWTQSNKANYDYIQQYLARSKFIKDSVSDRDKLLDEVDKSASKIKSLKEKPSKDLHKLQQEQNTYNAKRESFLTANSKAMNEISQFFEDKIDYFDWPLQNIILSLSSLFSTISTSHETNSHLIQQSPPYYNPVKDLVDSVPNLASPDGESPSTSSLSSSGQQQSYQPPQQSYQPPQQQYQPPMNKPAGMPQRPSPQPYQPQPQQVNSYQQPNQYQQPSPPNQYQPQYQQQTPPQQQYGQAPPQQQQYGQAPQPQRSAPPPVGGPARPAPPPGAKPMYPQPQQYQPQGGAAPSRPPPAGGVQMFPTPQQNNTQPPNEAFNNLSLNNQPPRRSQPPVQPQQQQYQQLGQYDQQQYDQQYDQQQQYQQPGQYGQQQPQQPQQPPRPQSTQFKSYPVPRPAGSVPQPSQQQMNQAGGYAVNLAQNPAVQQGAMNMARNPAVQQGAMNMARNPPNQY